WKLFDGERGLGGKYDELAEREKTEGLDGNEELRDELAKDKNASRDEDAETDEPADALEREADLSDRPAEMPASAPAPMKEAKKWMGAIASSRARASWNALGEPRGYGRGGRFDRAAVQAAAPFSLLFPPPGEPRKEFHGEWLANGRALALALDRRT